MINVAIMGHGVVGSGVAEILLSQKQRIQQKTKDDVTVKYILDLRDFDELPYRDLFIKDFDTIINDNSIKVVVEVLGGTKPAYDFVKRCLLAGKSVVSSNKELVAAHGAELLEIASQQNVNFLFEASVGGGIPVLRPMAQCLAANEIVSISGILNGTTNYILNKMIMDNLDFDSALVLAQKKGYAEKNPAADIEGHDACRKICILASLGFGKHIYPEQVPTQGITNITLDDVEYADRLGGVIKLIGHAEKLDNGKISAWVRPCVVPRESILSNVNGVFNAILVTGDETGDVMFYGKGAGKLPTASAVVADVIDCVKHITARKYLYWEDGAPDTVDNTADLETKLYVRIKTGDYKGLLSQFKEAFGDLFHIGNKATGEIVFMTGIDTESVLKAKTDLLTAADETTVIHALI